jgi:hypothetical protein
MKLHHFRGRWSRLDFVLSLDVSRAPADTTDDLAIISGFAKRFRRSEVAWRPIAQALLLTSR